MLRALDSERFHLRPLVKSDFAFLLSLQTNPEVMKYITQGVSRTEAQVTASHEAGLRLSEEHPGLGVWIIEQKPNFETVGVAILRLPDASLNMHGFELGYTIAPAYWGQGVATEVATRLVDYAFAELKLYRLVAIIDPHHEASRKILTKLGFGLTAPVNYHDPYSGVALASEAYYLDNPNPHGG